MNTRASDDEEASARASPRDRRRAAARPRAGRRRPRGARQRARPDLGALHPQATALPGAPVLSDQLKKLLESTEKKRDDKRIEAIGLLRGFLAANPTGDARAEGTFKLAELLWEEARRTFLIRMEDYGRAIEACNNVKQACEQPKEPKIELKEAETLYREIHDSFPNYPRMDSVTYLIGFASKEDNREDEAMAKFQEVIDKHPTSPLYGDSWMQVGEHYFEAKKWTEARAAYTHIPPDAATADLALFKTAWCEWKLGNTEQAAKDFKLVLDKAIEAERTGTEAQRRAVGVVARRGARAARGRVHRGQVDLGEGGLRLSRVDRRRKILARRADQGRRELRRPGRVRPQQRGVPVPGQDGIRCRSRPRTTSAR